MGDWKSDFDERQLKEIEFARLYARDFKHGTVGHNRLMLVDKLATTLDQMGNGSTPPEKILEFTVLDVDYHSQHEADAKWFRKDCGPACVEMVGKYFRPANDISTNEIMQSITKGGDRSIYIRELQKAASHFFGVDLDRHDGAGWEDIKRWIENDRPPIVLMHYGSFATRIDRNYTGGHFMVVCGYDAIDYQGQRVERVICHDPDFYGALMSQGAFIPITQDHFMAMWEDAYKDAGNPRRMALVARG